MKKRELVQEAEIFSKKAHKGQKQVSGKPYFNHPKQVAKLLKNWKLDDEIIIAGLLHDVVEDSNIPLKTLEKKFGKRVAFLVDVMSFILVNGKKDMDATYKKFIKHLKKEPDLIFIKIADILSNIPNINVKSNREFIINKSYSRMMMFWLPLIKELGFKQFKYRIQKEFNKYTKRKVKSVLFNYISKDELKIIKSKLNQVNFKEI